ncbi:MAG: DUF4331 domain-containing protein [Candidatus Peribacteraceae bacterium]|nr:DUF4331 domain-containing protein [Candidatus Peribacteraceae bacterium]
MSQSLLLRTKGVTALAAAASVVAMALGPVTALASSHREAPMISQDPTVDATDLYAFISPTDSSKVVFVANSSPFQYADAGPNYYRFSDDAVYGIHMDTNGDAKEDVSFVFDFWTKVDNGGTFLYNTKPVSSPSDLNVHQYWNAYRIKGAFNGSKNQMSKGNLVATGEVAAPVIGSKSITDYDGLAKKAIVNAGAKGTFFAGQRDDSFFVDLKVFDLLNLGGGKDSLAGANVNSIVFEVPVKGLIGSDPVIGVWSANYRPAQTVLKGDGTTKPSASWVQVSRLGMPLVNEVVVPLAYKDYFNASKPVKDADTKPYAAVVLKPELAGLFKAVLGLNVPTENRKDLVTVFLTGVPSLNQPKGVRAAEMLRLNTSIKPSAEPNRLGVFGGDNAGFPNGRRLADDVTDIAIQAVAGKLVEGYTVDAALGDGVNANDATFSDTFPYLATPHLTK